MAIEGSLSDVGLADICQLLSLTLKTGCLTVTDRSDFGYIFFESGRVVFASVLNQPDRLGELLVKNAAIQPEDLDKAMEEQGKEGGRRLGEILVEMEAVSREELEKWVAVQVEEAVFHLLGWTSGTFHFNAGEAPDEDQGLLVSLSADALLMEGARRVDEWTVIEEKVPSLDLIFEVVRDPIEVDDVDLSANQKRIIPLLDGHRTVRELVSESGLVEFETGKALFELLQAGFIQPVGERGEDGESADESGLQTHLRLGRAFYSAGMLEDAAREFGSAVEEEAAEPTALLHLGIIALREGDPHAAVEHFKALPSPEASSPTVLRNLALALEAVGRYEEALSVLEEAGSKEEEDPDQALARGIIELKAGEPRAARATFNGYRRAVGKGDPPPLFFAYSVLAAACSGHTEAALTLGREGLSAYPDEPTILVNTGVILDRKGDHEVAEQYFLRALQAGSDAPPQAHKNLGDQAFRRGDMTGARSQYEAAVRLDPSLGDDVFLKLGTIATADGDKDLAVLFLRRAVELNPENEEARAHLADLSALP